MAGGLFWLQHMAYMAASTAGGGGEPAAESFIDVMTSLSPAGWWRLGDASGTVASDEMGVQDGYYYNTPTLGVVGYVVGDTGVTFASASSEYVQVPHNAAYDLGTNDFSLMAAIKTAAWDRAGATDIFVKGDAGTSEYGIQTYPWGSYTDLYVRVNGVAHQFETQDLDDNAWHLLGVSCDRSGNAIVYVDGVAAGTADISAQSGASLSGSQPLGIAAETSPSVAGYFNGSIDEVAIWSGTAVSSADWVRLHAARNV